MQAPGFFNPKVQQDIGLGCEGATIADWELPFCTQSTASYFQYAFINLGIGGLFLRNTPGEYAWWGVVNAYTENWAETPVYLGGN